MRLGDWSKIAMKRHHDVHGYFPSDAHAILQLVAWVRWIMRELKVSYARQ